MNNEANAMYVFLRGVEYTQVMRGRRGRKEEKRRQVRSVVFARCIPLGLSTPADLVETT